MQRSVYRPNFQDYWNHMPRRYKTPASWPDREVRCSRTPTKHRTQNTIWENTQTEQDDYIHEPDCERSNRNSFISWKLQQGGRLHIKSYMAASNKFTKTLSTTRNTQAGPRANDLSTPPTNQRSCIPSGNWPNGDTKSTQLDTKWLVLVLPNH